MLLRWRDVEITGITTVAEANGRRAGYVRQALAFEGTGQIPVAAGADVSQGFYRYPELGYPDEVRYWGATVAPLPNHPDDALQILKHSVEEDATIIAIGPFTNLFLLDCKFPGILAEANLFLMGGYILPIRPGFPNWGNDFDWNFQVDVQSAKHVIESSNPTLIPLTVTVETALRSAYLNELQAAGALGALIARQAREFAKDEQNEKKYGETCEGLPNDLINFLHDPLACAIALGWNEGVQMQELSLTLEQKGGWLHERIDPAGKPTCVVSSIDGPRFDQFWLETVTQR